MHTINIKYYKGAVVFYNEMETDLNELRVLLKADFVDNTQVVRISAEQDIPLQELINLMDLIRASGFEKIFVATLRENN